MNDQYFGTKELYNVVLKATENTKFGARNLEKGEPVTYFDHIQIATLDEHINPVYARGGRGNDPLVIWEDRQQVGFNLTFTVIVKSDMLISLPLFFIYYNIKYV